MNQKKMHSARPKYLITGGCSFSQLHNADVTWPVHLTDRILPDNTQHTGQGAADNTTISRKVIHRVSKLLSQGVDPGQILVGIMWSGVDRHSVYSTNKQLPHISIAPSAWEDGQHCFRNPLNIASEHRNHYIINPQWSDQTSTIYYKYFHDEIGSQMFTLENVLRTQWFLQSLGIDFFMTEYSWYSVHDHRPPENEQITILDHPDLKYLLDLIDHDCWLPISCMTDWVLTNQIPYSRPNDNHPSTLAHQQLVDQIIVPHLNSRNLLNRI